MRLVLCGCQPVFAAGRTGLAAVPFSPHSCSCSASYMPANPFERGKTLLAARQTSVRMAQSVASVTPPGVPAIPAEALPANSRRTTWRSPARVKPGAAAPPPCQCYVAEADEVLRQVPRLAQSAAAAALGARRTARRRCYDARVHAKYTTEIRPSEVDDPSRKGA